MAVNITQTKYFQNIGPGGNAMSFGTLATTMGLPTSGGVRIGAYIRKTSANEVFADVNASAATKANANGIVPDSIENRTCGVDGNGIPATTSNLKISSFKNMIKRWDVSYTGGSNSQVNISGGGGVIGGNWSSNLDLNIPKRVNFDGSTWKASTVNEHAVVFSGSALNLDLTFPGTYVLGREGTGGSGQTNNSAATSGNSGGGALYLRNTTSRTSGSASTINLNLANTALIAGGGGGGGGGPLGNVSGTTVCSNVYNYVTLYNWDWWYSCPAGCAAGETQNFCNVGNESGNYSVSYFRGQRAQGTWYWTPWRLGCTGGITNNIGQVAPSSGGAGGVGQGSNNANPGDGGAGAAASSLNCPAGTTSQNSTSNSSQGFSGAGGGTYGIIGGATNVANGGSPGPWLNVSNTRWANKGASGVLVQRVNIA